MVKALKPLIASLLFIVLSTYFTIYFPGTLTYFNLNPNSPLALFVSSPFNMTTEGYPLYNLFIPAFLIFIIGVYLVNFNRAFQRKCSLKAVFLMSILASYMKSVGSMIYYHGASDYGISLGTSIIVLSFIVTMIISLEVYVDKKRLDHLYSYFVFSILSALVLCFAGLLLSFFFISSSLLVHMMGLISFLMLLVPYYERHNIAKFFGRGKKAAHLGQGHRSGKVQPPVYQNPAA